MILDVYRVTTYRNVHRILILIILGSFVAWKTFAIVSRFMSRNGCCCCCCCCCCCTQKIILHLSAKLFSIQKFSSAAVVDVDTVVNVVAAFAAFAGVTVVVVADVVADVVAAAVTIFYLRCLTSRQMVSLSPFSLL